MSHPLLASLGQTASPNTNAGIAHWPDTPEDPECGETCLICAGDPLYCPRMSREEVLTSEAVLRFRGCL